MPLPKLIILPTILIAMKKYIVLMAAATLGSGAAVAQQSPSPEAGRVIRIATDQTDLILKVGPQGRLYQTYFGERLANPDETALPAWDHRASTDGAVSRRGWETYATNGTEDFFEPALGITHADGNPATYLYYQGSETTPVEGGEHTRIFLRDDKYPVEVTLNYVAYPKQNVIKTWSEISHNEQEAVSLTRYASGMLYKDAESYFLRQFSSDWAREMQQADQRLLPGKKVIDSKQGSRANEMMQPFFEVGINGPVEEHSGEVLMGTLGWTGNFSFTFEVDNIGTLRTIAGINPYASVYELKAGETFTTPEFIFTLSQNGTAQGSRDLHDWARLYSLKDGTGPRMTLLNNWENTYFDFDQQKLGKLMREASDLGVEMFLLDDGWFGNKHPRNSDSAGLGDWEANRKKLPGGIHALVDSAKAAGVKFGIWIEPEMVNPRSELFEQHPDWVIMQPNRDTYLFRKQLVLDLGNPQVQDYVFGVVDKILTENPEVAYFKWDCNSPITNVYSPYAGEKQGQLYVDHVRGLYNVLERVKEKYPDVPMMLCSGGGGRSDFEALKYFTEFWPSDDTDPVERIFIQWGFSQFMPAKTLAAHVTSWNRDASLKFRTDVASMGRLGFDIGLEELSPAELAYAQQAVKNWHALAPATMEGDLYRLVSPYSGNHSAVDYVAKDKNLAVLFAFDIYPRYGEPTRRVRLQGLDPQKSYLVEEINLMPGAGSSLAENGKTFSGDYLMKVGLDAFTANRLHSRVVRLQAQ